MKFLIDGTEKVVFGGLAVVSADNLESLVLGGFKESCSALKMCRYCMATKEDSQTKVCWYTYVHMYKYSNCSFMKNNLNYEKKHPTKSIALN